MTRLAAHPQKAVFQKHALEVILEFTLYITRRFPALGNCSMRCSTACIHAVVLRRMGSEYRVIRFDDLVEQGLLGPGAPVTTSIPPGWPS